MATTYRAEESYYYRRDFEDKVKAIIGGSATVRRCWYAEMVKWMARGVQETI
jgi:hypothetical protein